MRDGGAGPKKGRSVMAIFHTEKTVCGYQVTLTQEAVDLIGVKKWSGTLDQYARVKMTSMSKAPGAVIWPNDILGMLCRFFKEATAYTRECHVLPYRPCRHSLQKKIMCEVVAQIANERLVGVGPFSPGVNTHGLCAVFTPIITRDMHLFQGKERHA